MPPSTTLITLSGKFSERRSQLDYYMIQKAIEDQQEIEKLEQPFKVEQEISSDQQLKSTMALEEERDSHSFWPDGIESWHIHESMPQREVFRHCSYSDPTTITQHLITELQSVIVEKSSDPQTNNVVDETVCQSDEANYVKSQHMTEPSMDQFKTSKNISSNTAESLQILSVVSGANEQQQNYQLIPKITYLELKLKPQYKWNETSRKLIQNDLSTVSKSFEHSSIHYQPHNRLLPLIVTCLIQLLLFLFSVLIRTGSVHNLTKLSGILYDQSSTHDSESISDKLSMCSKKFLKKSRPYGKTIKILRDLESLLIYAII
jgi:hypothetical protein